MRKLVLISSLILLAGAGCSKVNTELTDSNKADSAQSKAVIQEEKNPQKKAEVKNEVSETANSEEQNTEGGMNVQAEIKANTKVKASEEEKTEEPKEPADSNLKSSETVKTGANPTAPSSEDKTVETAKEPTAPAQEPVQSTKEFSITAKKWEFVPSIISVNKGDKVKLTVESIDVDHGFSIAEFGVKRTLKPGQTEIIEFTADQSGTFSFFCSVSCGSGHSSMKGTLIIK